MAALGPIISTRNGGQPLCWARVRDDDNSMQFHFKFRQNLKGSDWFYFSVCIANMCSQMMRRFKKTAQSRGDWLFIMLMFLDSFEGQTNTHIALCCIWDSSCQYTILYRIPCSKYKISFELIHIQFNVFFETYTHNTYTLKIRLANLHSQSAIYGGFSSLDTAVLFVIESLSLLQARIWGHSVFAFSFIKACWTDCQTCRIKNKSIYVLRTNSQTSNKQKDSA